MERATSSLNRLPFLIARSQGSGESGRWLIVAGRSKGYFEPLIQSCCDSMEHSKRVALVVSVFEPSDVGLFSAD